MQRSRLVKQSKREEAFSNTLLYLFLAILVLFPSTLVPIKYGLLILMGGCACWFVIRTSGKIGINNAVFVLWIYYLCLGFFFVLRGILNGAKQPFPVVELYIIYPSAYMIFIALVRNLRTVVGILKLLILCSVPVSILVIMQAMILRDINFPFVRFLLSLFPSGALHSEISYMPRVLPSLIFFMPLTFCGVLVYSKEDAPLPRFILWASFLLSLAAVIVGQRRGLLLILFLSPIILLLLSSFLGRKKMLCVCWKLMILLTLLMTSGYLIGDNAITKIGGMKWQELISDFNDAFAFESSESAKVRKEQFYALVGGLNEKPILGAGLGVGSDQYVRDQERPWNYELRYLALLFQTGILGFLFYMLGVIWIFWKSLTIIRKGTEISVHMVPVTAGFIGALIAEATNPYLNQFGHLWMIFIPVAMINRWLIDREKALEL